MFLPLFKPNKAGLFEGSFSERCQSDPPPPTSSLHISLKKAESKKMLMSSVILLYADVISFFATRKN